MKIKKVEQWHVNTGDSRYVVVYDEEEARYVFKGTPFFFRHYDGGSVGANFFMHKLNDKGEEEFLYSNEGWHWSFEQALEDAVKYVSNYLKINE